MKREVKKQIFGIIGLLITLLLFRSSAMAVEFEAEGIIKRDSIYFIYTVNFNVYVNGEKYCIKYSTPANDFEYAYDGDYVRTLIKSKKNDYEGYIKPGPVLQNWFHCEAGAIWLGLCSTEYFKNLKDNMIEPIQMNPKMDKIFPEYGFKCPARIEYLNESYRVIKRLEFYNDILQRFSRVKYEAFDFTNINGYTIPLKFKITQMFSNYEDRPFLVTNEIHEAYLIWITNKCSLKNFRPTITQLTRFHDMRFAKRKGYSSEICYFASNWLSDSEILNNRINTNLTLESNEINYKQMNNKSTVFGKVIFISILIISIVLLGVLLIKQKNNQ